MAGGGTEILLYGTRTNKKNKPAKILPFFLSFFTSMTVCHIVFVE